METIEYGRDFRQTMWAHPQSTHGGTWLVVIHGGLWRDHTITWKQGIRVATELNRYFSGVASIDYRLTPEVTHPDHMNDCRAAVELLKSHYKVERFVFLGHSAGCYLAGQIAPFFQTKLVIGLEGLYDLDDFVAEYPELKGRIEDAFPKGDWIKTRPDWQNIPLAIVHSKTDELVSLRQPAFAQSLNPKASISTLNEGTHNSIFEKMPLENVLAPILNEYGIERKYFNSSSAYVARQ